MSSTDIAPFLPSARLALYGAVKDRLDEAGYLLKDPDRRSVEAMAAVDVAIAKGWRPCGDLLAALRAIADCPNPNSVDDCHNRMSDIAISALRGWSVDRSVAKRETHVLPTDVRREVSEATWGTAHGRAMHHDPLMHVLVQGDRLLCTGTPGHRRMTTATVPTHSCRLCVSEWVKQT